MSSNSLLKQLLSNANPELIDKISSIIKPDAEEISDSFYKYVQLREESAKYLDNMLVHTKLRSSMKQWLEDLFVTRSTDGDVDKYIERQIFIGNRHARINLPLPAMQIGTSTIKREIFRRVILSEMSPQELTEAIVFIDEFIDITINVMNQAFVTDLVSDAKDQQTIRMQSIGIDMAIQSESLRASLFDWHRQIIKILYEGGHDIAKIPSIRRTNFGLWVIHKGDLMFSGTAEIDQLKEITMEIDGIFDRALLHCKKPTSEVFKTALSTIDKHIENASEILGLMTDRSLTLEGGRDQLTRLFNRRFLRTVMQGEIRSSLSTGEAFAVLLLDIDYFKKINDQYGHDSGDLVLRKFSEVIVASIRAGDFAFRYGGEEFLCIIAAVELENAKKVAEKIRRSIEHHLFFIEGEQKVKMTVSIGLAMFDGHPDYSNLISNADLALYQAKQGGRNCCQVYDPKG